MVINLSEEVIETVYNSLRSSKQDLKRQLNRENKLDKKAIIEHQLEEVEDAFAVFEELMDSL